jgi:hypothetical protein
LLRNAVFLQTPQLLGHLLIAELQLLDDAGHLPDLGLETIDANAQIAGRGLRQAIAMIRRRRLAAPEETVEEPGRFVRGGLA